jgi:hypothetical protein
VSNYQIVHVGRGKHLNPGDGACVMELASMLAGEPFSDHPRSVCKAIAAFLRGYNDTVGDDLRQDLYATAATVIGSHATSPVTSQRVELCCAFGRAAYRTRRVRIPLIDPFRGHKESAACLAAGAEAARAALRDRGWHDATLVLVDELVAIHRRPSAPMPPVRERAHRAAA